MNINCFYLRLILIWSSDGYLGHDYQVSSVAPTDNGATTNQQSVNAMIEKSKSLIWNNVIYVTAIYKGSVKRGKEILIHFTGLRLDLQTRAKHWSLLHRKGLTLDLQKGFLKFFLYNYSSFVKKHVHINWIL